ncbi:alpha/beta hydrolase [Halorubellus sp. JP-L1]|uniref:alpha/beta fold hydrolase n=1 Tax=Halorubellus sp. JP-L1 TaxID=2715753 RepID=UPI0014093559|nr:alpha/beta hydrolase [Halorubellus sp. JP-L1]NHN40152.1 alpha/beta hydrolase [Halorubellus sp. JP-L1]
MRAKKALYAAGGVVGAIGVGVLTDRLLRRRAGDLPRPLPGAGETYRWRGMDTYYTDLGNPDNPTLVLVHGVNAAASSNEFVSIAEALAADYHVVAPDLPGFGRSDRPPIQYTNEHYEDFLRAFLEDVAGEDATVLASSLSAAYAVEAAKGASVSRLVLVSPTASTMPGGEKPMVRRLLRSPVVGTLAFDAIASERSLEYFSADHSYYDADAYATDRKRYDWQTTHQSGARYAPASFVAGYLDSDVDLGAAIADLDVPTTLVWGREAETTPLSTGRELADRANAKLVVVDYAALLPHDEHPEAFLDGIADDLDLDRDVEADRIAVERE